MTDAGELTWLSRTGAHILELENIKTRDGILLVPIRIEYEWDHHLRASNETYKSAAVTGAFEVLYAQASSKGAIVRSLSKELNELTWSPVEDASMERQMLETVCKLQ